MEAFMRILIFTIPLGTCKEGYRPYETGNHYLRNHLNDLNAEKSHPSEPQATCNLGMEQGSHTPIEMKFHSYCSYTGTLIGNIYEDSLTGLCKLYL